MTHGLIEDQAGVRIIDGTIAADDQLRHVGDIGVLAPAPEFRVRVDHSWDALGGVKSRDLDDVLASGPVELSPKISLLARDSHRVQERRPSTHMR